MSQQIPIEECSCQPTVPITERVQISYPKMQQNCLQYWVQVFFSQIVICISNEPYHFCTQKSFIRRNMGSKCLRANSALNNDVVTICAKSSLDISTERFSCENCVQLKQQFFRK